MKNLPTIILLACLAACTNKADKYSTSRNAGDKEIVTKMDANLWAMMRYLGKPPEGLTPPERFYPGYDSHYVAQMKLHVIDAWYKDGDMNYFLVSRSAPSVTKKRVATGGKVIFDEEGKIKEYEEMFRTWRLAPDTLKKRAIILFDKMVKGEPLRFYETKYSNGLEYIEFPDEVNYFDKEERAWKVKR